MTAFCLPIAGSNYNACPSLTNMVYKGIMVGDVNASFSTNTFSTNLYRTSESGDKLIADLSKAYIHGNVVEVPVTFVSSSDVSSIDFAMKFDESNLTYNSVVNYAPATSPVAFFNEVSNVLKFDAINSDASKFRADQPVASIRFDAKSGIVNADQFNSLVGYINGDVVPFEVINRTVGVNSLNSPEHLVTIFPNPSNGIINITSFSDANVQVLDITGKEVLFQTSVIANKTQVINISEFANGVYVVKVSNNDFVTVKKVVLSK
jgi:hypothetical protein